MFPPRLCPVAATDYLIVCDQGTRSPLLGSACPLPPSEVCTGACPGRGKYDGYLIRAAQCRTIVFSDDGQLTAISPNGGQLRRLGEAPLTQYCSGADWSPDASRIAAVCNSQLVVLEAAGSGLRVLAPDAESAPSWSPDGNRTVYQSGTKLKMVGADGGAPSTIDLYGAEARDPDWSP